jgi:hypothetical protein
MNIGLAAATVVGLVLGILGLSGLGSERTAVVSAGEHGYASVARLTAARVLAFQAQGDESAALIARGNGQSYETDLDTAVGRVNTLLAASAAGADPSGLAAALSGWVAVDQKIRELDQGGQHDQAVALALGHASGDSIPTFEGFDVKLVAATTAEQQSFLAQTSKARKALNPLTLIATIGALLAIIATLAGIQPRVNEYR